MSVLMGKLIFSFVVKDCTDAMTMRRPAPLDPPMMETIKLGTMAMLRVIRFRSHCFILMSRNPCRYMEKKNLPVMVELCPEAKSATPYTVALDFPSTF
ncbi:Os07g0258501 [Oryza sativa Japonica Group]|uniref:Os07g0258501 protein n=1 Tax=Oryza sativa subsp. japonica TaxID=39947 RepID=A0A0P0X485_ORYSJ|nr:hypothetical protein EE612_038301 [Oryza sativa]BAT00881.1 Os07g0258501 [Oryza sativa Japonica Group]